MYFSCVLQEKYQKKQAKGALNARSSRTGAAPFGNPRRASPLVPEHLNLNPVQAENVPIFCLKASASEDGWAEIGTFPPCCKNFWALQVQEGWYIGGDGLYKVPSYVGFFSPFSCRNKKRARKTILS